MPITIGLIPVIRGALRVGQRELVAPILLYSLVIGVMAASALAAHSPPAAVGALLKAGDDLVSSTDVYGGTYRYFEEILPRIGVNVRWCDALDPEQIAAAIRVIVQLQRLSDGKRKVTSIAEITGLEGDIIQMQEIFKFVRTGTAPDNSVVGHFQATGVRPRFLADLIAMGIKIPGSYFDPSQPL